MSQRRMHPSRSSSALRLPKFIQFLNPTHDRETFKAEVCRVVDGMVGIDVATLRIWMDELPSGELRRFRAGLTDFCATLGIEWSWLEQGTLADRPDLQRSLVEAVTLFILSYARGTIQREALARRQRFQHWLKAPHQRDNQILGGKLFAALVEQGKLDPPPDIQLASAGRRRMFATQAVREAALQDPDGFDTILARVLDQRPRPRVEFAHAPPEPPAVPSPAKDAIATKPRGDSTTSEPSKAKLGATQIVRPSSTPRQAPLPTTRSVQLRETTTPARTITVADRIKYAFDMTMAGGTIALIAWLSLISILVVVVATVVMIVSATILGDPMNQLPLFDYFWINIGSIVTPFILTEGSTLFRSQNLIVNLIGLLIVSILVGIVTTGIEDRIQQLRKGRSFVLEQEHTVILGWSPQIFTIVSQLIQANLNQRRPVIAILGDADKVEMEDLLRERIEDRKNTRIVVRSGSPMETSDLEIINLYTARSIIVLPPEHGEPDITVLKTLLALKNLPGRTAKPFHVVTSLQDMRNRSVAHMIGEDEVRVVLADDLIARLTVQTSIQAGLAVIYTDLLSFEGSEIYFKAEPTLVGRTFGSLLLAYQTSTVIGIHRAHDQTLLNPPMETTIEEGDQIIFIAEDDDTIHLAEFTSPPVDRNAILATVRQRGVQQRQILMLGWNRRAPFIIAELNRYVTAGSNMHIIANSVATQQFDTFDWSELENLTVTFQTGNISDRALLDSMGLERYAQVLVLSESDQLASNYADARTLVTLLHLRDICEQSQIHVSVTSEMMDSRNRDLAAITQADDFIISERLVSLLLTQLSENGHLLNLFDGLFGVEGSEIYLKPMSNYVDISQPINFYTVVAAAQQLGEVAIGYRLLRHRDDPVRQFGVKLNPGKHEMVLFDATDMLIVIAES